MAEALLIAAFLAIFIGVRWHSYKQKEKIKELEEHLARERYRAELIADRSRDQRLEIERLRFQLESSHAP